MSELREALKRRMIVALNPFRSEAQRRFMFAQHPEIAKRWVAEHPASAAGGLPEHVGNAAPGSKFQEFLHPRLRGKFRDKGGVHFPAGAPGAQSSTTDPGAAPHGQPGHTAQHPAVAPAGRVDFVAAKFVGGKWTIADGSPLPAHVAKLRLPPAWRDVKVSTNPNVDLVAQGFDAKGRLQSVYSEQHWAEAAAAKFARTKELIDKFDEIARQNMSNAQHGDHRENADVMALIMATGIRPGSDADTGAEKKAFGATTLQGRHVVIDGDNVRLRFVGKKGVDLDIEITDAGVAGMIKSRAAKAGWKGRLFNTDAARLLEYVHTLDGGSFKTKDFRTALGTRTAAELVSAGAPPKSAKEFKARVREVAVAVAKKLGNTPTVALQSYIDPSVFSAWRQV